MDVVVESLKSVFVSFSGRDHFDKEFVKHLISRFREHNIDPWIYEMLGSEIPVSKNIADFCREKIRKSDYFVAIISDSSLNSEYAQVEVRLAIAIYGVEGIFQVATTRTDSYLWPEPYLSLTAAKRIDAHSNDAVELERIVEAFCVFANLDYKIPSSESPKLPLLSRLTNELYEAVPDHIEYDTGIFSELRKKAIKADQAYAKGNLELAHNAIDAMLYELQDNFANTAFYYPKLVKGILLLELSGKKPSKAESARRIFIQILGDPLLSNKLDENAFAALAASEHRLGNYSRSLELYRLANDFVIQHERLDGDLIHNIVVASIAAGEKLTYAERQILFEQHSLLFLTEDPFLSERIAALRVLVLIQEGHIEEALYFLNGSQLSKPDILDVLIRLAQESAQFGVAKYDGSTLKMAEDLFLVSLKMAEDETRSVVVRSYAKFLYECADFYGALNLIREEMRRREDDPCLMMEAIWCLIQTDEWQEARKILASIVNLVFSARELESSDTLAEFHYFRGFANWWLGSFDKAAQEFRDSGMGEDRAYEKIACIHLSDKYQYVAGWLQNDLAKSLH
ncbi:MAG: toll/interleukin-1 receptor domain-containing protein [Methylococcales bacterium]